MDRKLFYHTILCLVITNAVTGMSSAEDHDRNIPLSFSGDVAATSKYIWRGQRLTDGWSLQPAGTLGIGNFSLNVWGNMDLAAVNEGDALFLKEDPVAPPGGNNGLQGHFSEVDYTFSYSIPLEKLGLEAGAIVYTFPERSASLPSTVELYGGLSLDSLPLAPIPLKTISSISNGKLGETDSGSVSSQMIE